MSPDVRPRLAGELLQGFDPSKLPRSPVVFSDEDDAWLRAV
jgi:hypothetical protein